MGARDDPDLAGEGGAVSTLPGRDRLVSRIVRSWRELTGGTSRAIPDVDRRTLIACSAGADSSALVLALSSATREIAVAHVVHDLRAPAEVQADLEAASELAASLHLPFVRASIQPAAEGGNAEGQARRLRYRALEGLARETACGFVATAHHADDQLETMLMALARGAGPGGLAGIAHARPLGEGVRLIRPMLSVTRADAHAICRHAKWTWREDATNRDESRVRAAIRHTVIPALERVRPGVAMRAVRAAELQAGAAELIDQAVDKLYSRASRSDSQLTWDRRTIAQTPPIVLGGLIRRAAADLGDGCGLDRINGRTIDSIIRATRGRSGRTRVFQLHALVVTVSKMDLTIGKDN